MRRGRFSGQARVRANRGASHQDLEGFAQAELEADAKFLGNHPGWTPNMVHWLKRFYSKYRRTQVWTVERLEQAWEFVFVTSGGDGKGLGFMYAQYKNEKGKDPKLCIQELEGREE